MIQVSGKTVRIEMINCEENETNAKLAQQFGRVIPIIAVVGKDNDKEGKVKTVYSLVKKYELNIKQNNLFKIWRSS